MCSSCYINLAIQGNNLRVLGDIEAWMVGCAAPCLARLRLGQRRRKVTPVIFLDGSSGIYELRERGKCNLKSYISGASARGVPEGGRLSAKLL